MVHTNNGWSFKPKIIKLFCLPFFLIATLKKNLEDSKNGDTDELIDVVGSDDEDDEDDEDEDELPVTRVLHPVPVVPISNITSGSDNQNKSDSIPEIPKVNSNYPRKSFSIDSLLFSKERSLPKS